jgi:cytochrome P450
MAGSRNLLEMWEEESFTNDFGRSRILMREVFTCNSADSVQFAFSLKNASFERKAPQMRHSLQPLLGDGLFVSDGDTWRKRRRMVAPIVHISQLARFAPVMVEVADEVRARWARSDGATLDILAESATLTAEVICRALFGRKLGRDYARQVVDGFSEYQRLIGQIDLFSLLGLPDWMPRWYGPALRRSIRRIHGVLDHVIESYRNARGSDEDSVIQRLLDARDPDSGQPLDPQALRNEIAVLFMAGHETTANSMAWSWFLLSQAPEAEEKLHRELASVLGGRLPTLADMPKLVFTRAVFEEAMRLYPPVPILPREALREEYFGTFHIPRGAILLVVPWLLHRNPKYWEKPDHFIPERFLPENSAGISKFVYIPFSIGPRICAGMSFGLTEAILCLATLAQHFRLRLKPGHVVRPVCRLTLRPEGGLPMSVHRRSAAATSPAPATAAAPASCPFHNA